MRTPLRGAAVALAILTTACAAGPAVAAAQTVTTTVTVTRTPSPAPATSGSSTASPGSSTTSGTDSDSTSTTGSSTTTSSTTTSSTGTAGGETNPTPRGEALALLALLFGAVGVLIVVVFLAKDRAGTRATFSATVAAGQYVTGIGEAASGVAAPGALLARMAGVAAEVPEIEGPGEVVVGTAAAFIAKVGDNEAIATWTVDPPAAAELPAGDTNRLLLVARQPGPFKLTAKVGGEASEPKQVNARPASAKASVLPFLGAGWGGVVVGIVIASITAALGFAHALSTDAVATILGALVGYVVAKSQGEPGPGGSSGAGGAGGSGGTQSTGA
jgi:hypothetical protein